VAPAVKAPASKPTAQGTAEEPVGSVGGACKDWAVVMRLIEDGVPAVGRTGETIGAGKTNESSKVCERYTTLVSISSI
jgi:hypothetical protein